MPTKRTLPTVEQLLSGKYLSYKKYQLDILGFNEEMYRYIFPDADNGERYSKSAVIYFLNSVRNGQIKGLRHSSILKAEGMYRMLTEPKVVA